jgi:LysM repeat protein
LKNENINLISDVYSTNSELTTKSSHSKYTTVSPKQNENISFRGVINIPGNENVDIITTLGKLKDLSINDDNGIYTLSGNVEVTLIYKTDSNIESSSVDMPINHVLSTVMNNISTANLLNIESTQAEQGKFDIKLSMNVEGNTLQTNTINIISEISEIENSSNNNKGIIIYYPKSDDTLWKIAKKYGTTVDKLKTINNITDSNIIIAGNPLIIN